MTTLRSSGEGATISSSSRFALDLMLDGLERLRDRA
jgi:hypothetical protein